MAASTAACLGLTLGSHTHATNNSWSKLALGNSPLAHTAACFGQILCNSRAADVATICCPALDSCKAETASFANIPINTHVISDTAVCFHPSAGATFNHTLARSAFPGAFAFFAPASSTSTGAETAAFRLTIDTNVACADTVAYGRAFPYTAASVFACSNVAEYFAAWFGTVADITACSNRVTDVATFSTRLIHVQVAAISYTGKDVHVAAFTNTFTDIPPWSCTGPIQNAWFTTRYSC
jgi:hypothetical protein